MAARAHRPDVAVLDLQMPGIDGIAAAKEILRDDPGCRVLIVTSHGMPGHLKRSLEAGVSGFVPKTISATKLADAIRTVHDGGRATSIQPWPLTPSLPETPPCPHAKPTSWPWQPMVPPSPKSHDVLALPPGLCATICLQH